jgi:hypothetical protein
MYAEEGKGYKSLADTLNQEGIATPRDPAWSYIYSGKWTDTTIRAILVNPVYAGDKVIDFYRSYLAPGGRRKLAQAVKAQIGSEAEEFVAARKRAQRQQDRIKKIINNLLDNIITNSSFLIF